MLNKVAKTKVVILLIACFTPVLAQGEGFVITGVNLLPGDDTDVIGDATIVVEDGLISCAGSSESCPTPSGLPVTHLPGHWVMPGLIDTHVHYLQSGWPDSRPRVIDVQATHPYEATIERLLSEHGDTHRSYLCVGVTGVFDAASYRSLRPIIADSKASELAPYMSGATQALAPFTQGFHSLPNESLVLGMSSEEEVRENIRTLAAGGADAIKLGYFPVPESMREHVYRMAVIAGEESRKYDLPLISHVTTLREAKLSLRAGATRLLHSVSDEVVDDEFIELMLQNGAYYVPTLSSLDGYADLYAAFAQAEPLQLDDPLGCVGEPVRSLFANTPDLGESQRQALAARVMSAGLREATRELQQRNLRLLLEAGVPVAFGSDAGNPGSPHGATVFRELRLMQDAGMTPGEVIRSATSVAARALDRDGFAGTLQQGHVADVLVLKDDPTADIQNIVSLVAVIRNGTWHDQADLRAPGR